MTTSPESKMKGLLEYANDFREGGMPCNCDLDNWEPERSTGHSWVCRIHKAAIAANAKAQGWS